MRKLFYTLFVLFLLGQTTQSQTVILSPTGAGGFENGDGSFAANGWTVVNGAATNQWYTGTVPTGFTNKAAYISNNAGAAWAYTTANISVTHFYRDVTIPAGETSVTLSFSWNARGETGFWDALMVGFCPTSVTPVAGTTTLGTGLPEGITNAGQFWTNAASATQSAVINLPEGILGNCSAPVTVRLVFTWKNDGSGGTSPPAAVDNISLVSQTTSAATPGRIPFTGGIFSINPALPNTGANFTTFSEAVTELNKLNSGCAVLSGGITFNVAAGAVFTENVPAIVTTGYTAAPIVFQKSGAGVNPVIKPAIAGTIASSTTLGSNGDAILTISGADYITFDGIDIATNSSFTGNGKYEYGYLLRKANAVNASKNVTIKNATITLDKPIYSFGIYVSNLIPDGSAAIVSDPRGRSESIKIFNNTISNVYGGINVTGSSEGFDQNIEIGVDGGNTITDFGGGATTTYGIYTIYQDALKIANNRITSAASGHTTTLYGILTSTAVNANADIYGNTITITGKGTTAIIYGISNTAGGTGTNNTVNIYKNTITGLTYTTATTGSEYLIHNSASAYNLNIYGNNLNNNSLATTTTGTFYGIFQDGAVVNSVKIYSDTLVNNSRTTGTTGIARGIHNTASATGTADIYANIISGLQLTGTTAFASGIYSAAGLTVKIYDNKLSDLTYTGTTGGIQGITVAAGTTTSIYNNFISDLKAPTTNNAAAEDGVRGISIASTTTTATNLIAHNTIYLNASSSGTNFSTAGVFHTGSTTATTSALDLRDNIIVNISTLKGTGKTVALRRSLASLNNYATSSNNNLFYAGTPAPGYVIYYDGTNADVTLADFKTRVAAREVSSISMLPSFVNVSAVPYDLHISPAVATEIESGGTPVAGVTTDIDGNPRNATTPDIGADEFAGIAADLTGPVITYTALPVRTICTNGPTITATITDASGVNAVAGTKPRLWFKKASENNVLPATNTSAANGWKWVEATTGSSPFDFTFNFSLLTSPLTGGDSISYFIVAQDLVATPNTGVNAATFSVRPASVALGAASFPVSGTLNGFKILVQPSPLSVKISRTDICASGTVTLDKDGIEITGGEFQWQSSPAGTNTWTDIPGATTIPYTTGVLTASTDFRLVLKCGGSPVASSPSPVVSVTVNNPQIANSVGASRCGPGTLALTASAPGYNINWYAASTGGTSLNSGGVFTTPPITATTTFYAAASAGGGSASTGLANAISTTNYTLEAGLFFNALSNFTLDGVYVYPTGTGAGTATIALQTTGGTTLQSQVVNLTGTSASFVKTYVPLNFTVPAGTDYRLVMLTRTGLVSGLIRESGASWGAYPITLPGVLTITNGKCCPDATSTSYYYFYDWKVSVGCEGTRVPVVATIVAPPAITKNGTPASICEGQSSTLTAGSANAGYTYTWTPGGLTGASVNVSPTVSTRYYVTALDNSGGTYNGCSNLDSVDISVSPIPSPLSISPSSAAVCASGGTAVELTANGGTFSKSYIFGTQAAQNTGSTTSAGFPAPYTVYYGGQRMQMLVRASELTAAGFATGSKLTSIKFPVVSRGSNWGSTTTSCNDFQVSIGATTSTSISTFASGLTQVISPANFTPVVGYDNTHVFGTPFVWDGTSNLIIETTFSNNITGTANDLVVQYNSPTSYQSCIVYKADGATAAAVAASTTVTYSYSARPDFTLNGTQAATITWSPATGLYTNPAATTTYTAGDNAAKVYAKPATPTTYTVTTSAACGNSATVNVAVTTPPSATIAYGASPYCNSGTATVTRSGSTGGTYTSATGLSIDAATGAINLAASAPGTYTVTYTIAASGGCGVFSTTAPVTINAAPSASISYTGSPFCTGSAIAMVTLTGTTGGTFSSTTGLSINATTGAIDIAASTLGTYTVTYTIAAAGGCPVYTTTTSVTITTSPAATISYTAAPYCTSGGMATVTRTGSSGGTYSSTTGLSINATTGAIDLAASTPGTYTVTYTIPAAGGCSVFSTTASVAINAAPSATISYAASPYCSGAGTATVTRTGTTGGTYSAAPGGLSIDAATGTVNLAGSGPGTYTVTYTVPAANGCVVYTTTTSVTISAQPAATISYAGSPYCNTGTTVAVSRTGTAGGTYSSTTGLSIDATTGTLNIAASSPGTYTVTYSIPAGNGCGVFSTTTTVSIVAPAAATISYAGSPYCTNGGTANVTRTGTTGGSYTSTTGLSINSSTGAINLGASSAGTYIVTYTVSAVTGCPAFTTSASVTITTAPSATINYTGSPFCSNGTTANVTRTGNAGGTYSSATGLSINATTGVINIAASTPGSYTVSYTVTGGNGCANYVATTPVIITQAPGATISYSGSPYCSAAGTATVTHSGTSGGTYSSTNGLSINATTGAIDLAASTAGTYVVSYTVAAANGCAIYSATTAISITALPSATISYSGSPYCGNGGTANVTRTGTAGGTYSSAAGLSINATTGAINIAASTPGTYTVTYAINATGACPAFSITTSVTITAPPAATISYAGSPYCSNAGTASVTRTGSAGGTYTSTTGLSINASTGAINLAASTAGTYTVTYTIAAAGGCAIYSTTATVIVTAAPAATISYAGSPYCGSTGTAVVTHTGTTGGTYSSTAGLSINPTTGAVNIAASTPGSYTVSYTVAAANGCAAYTASTTLLLTTPGTWTGLVSTDWNNAGNWCGGIPSAATDAIIPSAAPNMPVLSNGSGAVRNISAATGVVITIGTAGTLELYGNFTGTGTLNATNGSIVLRGVTNQQLPAFTATNLTMNMAGAGSSLMLSGNSGVTGTLTLANGNITLGSYNLSLGNSSNGKLASHIITNGSGNVIVTNLAASQNRTVPVGSDAVSYNPVALIANAGHTADNFTVRVQPGVYANGASGTSFPTHVVDRMWIINEGTTGGSNVNVTLQWSAAQELPDFTRTKSYVMQHNGTGWIAGTPSVAPGADPYTLGKTGVTTFGAFAVQTEPIPRPITGLYPNPANDHLNVVTDLLSTGPVVFSIYDDKGQLVYRKQEALTIGLNRTRLDIAHLSAGVYLLKVSTRLNEQFLVQRFLKAN